VLPTITLDLRRLLGGPHDGHRVGGERPQGETHTYSRERLGAAADEQALSVDEFLAWHAVGGLQPGRPASPVLILYGVTSEHVQLTVCGAWVGAALTRVPGRLESGRGAALPNAQPLLYWDGRRLRRIYALPARDITDGPLMEDLSMVVGRAVVAALPDQAQDPWHARLPDRDMREVSVGGEARRIGYAWWKGK